jgi:hypothetical protein
MTGAVEFGDQVRADAAEFAMASARWAREASQYAAVSAAYANRYPSFAAGVAANPTGVDFSVVDPAGRWIEVYRVGVSASAVDPLIRLPGAAGYAAGDGATLIGWQQEGTGPVPLANTVARKLEETVSLSDFGAAGGDVVRDTDALIKALDLARLRVRANGAGMRVKLPWLAGGDLLIDPRAIDEALAAVFHGAFPLTIAGEHFGSRIRPAAKCDYLFRLGGTATAFEQVTVYDPERLIAGAAWYGHAAPADYPTVLDRVAFGATAGSRAFLYWNEGAYRYDLINPRGQNIGGLLRNAKAGVQGRIVGGCYLSGGTYRGILLDGTTGPDAQAEGFRCDGGVLLMNGAADTVGVEILMGLDVDIRIDVNQLGARGVGVRIKPPAGKAANLTRITGFIEGGAGGRAIELIGTRGNIGDVELDVRLGTGSSIGVDGILARSVQRLQVHARAFYLDGRALDLADCAAVTVDAASNLQGARENRIAADVAGRYDSAVGAPADRSPAMAYPMLWTSFALTTRCTTGTIETQTLTAKYRIDGRTLWWETTLRIAAASDAAAGFHHSLPLGVIAESGAVAGTVTNGDHAVAPLYGIATARAVAIDSAVPVAGSWLRAGALVRISGMVEIG